jgi:hypothetical protein
MKIILESLDNVEEQDRQYFDETDDGKYSFNRGKFEESAKAGLLRKNKELLGKLKAAEPLEKFREVDDQTWQAFQQWRDEKTDESEEKLDETPPAQPPPPERQFDYKKLLKQEIGKVQEGYEARLREKAEELGQLQEKFDRYVLDQQLMALALEAGVIPERLDSFKRTIGDRFALRNGKLAFLEDGEESETPADKAIGEIFRKELDWFFAAREAGGGSGQQKVARAVGPKELNRSKMTPKEKSDYIREYGNEKYLKLPI